VGPEPGASPREATRNLTGTVPALAGFRCRLGFDPHHWMAGGLVGLLDDIAALAKLAAASVDDVGAAAGKASVKAAGVVVDDAAVTPTYVRGLAAERELPIIKRIAVGSLRNKLLVILPAALLLSADRSDLVEIILMFGGSYLAYEGAHKVIHALRHGTTTPRRARRRPGC
jgi:uncharacterized protein